jgi:hypothetical protein
MAPDTWECPACDTVNRTRASACMVCNASRATPARETASHTSTTSRFTAPKSSKAPVDDARPKTRGVRFGSTTTSSTPPRVAGTRPIGRRPHGEILKAGPRGTILGGKDRHAKRWAIFVLLTVVVPWAIGHYVWRPNFEEPYRLLDPRVLPAAVYGLPDYLFGAGAILGLVLLAFLIPPRRRRSAIVYVFLLLAAGGGMGLAGSAHHGLQSFGNYLYEHAGIYESAVVSNCRRPLVRWSTAGDDGDITWTATRSWGCAKVVVYRGWAAQWAESAHSGVKVLTVAHFQAGSGGLIAELSGNKSGRPNKVVLRAATTGRQAWSYRCPNDYGKLKFALFVGANGGSPQAPAIKGRNRYVKVQCAKRTVYLEAKSKKKTF